MRLRWHFQDRRFSKTVRTWKSDAEGRAKAEKVKLVVEKYLGAGRDPRVLFNMPTDAENSSGLTVREYYTTWVEEKRPPKVLPAQARDYRRHLEGYVLPHLGDVPITALTPRDLVTLQTTLQKQRVSSHGLARLQMGKRAERIEDVSLVLSSKYVRNILCGSFRAMLRDAAGLDMIAVPQGLFVGLKAGWLDHEMPEPDPLEPAEREAVLQWFQTKRFGLGPGTGTQLRVHPPFHAFLYLQFWTGCRPSEAAGLRWGDVDLAQQQIRIRGARHSYVRNTKTKTKTARRTIQLDSDLVAVLRAIMPLRVEPDMTVFTNTSGAPIEPKVFSSHWYRALRAVGIRVRGMYCAKDTFVSQAMSLGLNSSWIVGQTGVSWATLQKHYGKFQRNVGGDLYSEMRGTGSASMRKMEKR